MSRHGSLRTNMLGWGRAPFNIDGFRDAARRRLPRVIFDFVDGGAMDEVTVQRNRQGFARYAFAPRRLVDVSGLDLGTKLCGATLRMPLVLAPVGLAGMVHPDGEAAAVTAAGRHGTTAFVSTSGTYGLGELSPLVRANPTWFQLYPIKDRDTWQQLVKLALDAGFSGLCLTVDAPLGGQRERDVSNRFVAPFRIAPLHALDALRHPAWLTHLATGRRVVPRIPLEAQGMATGRPPLRSMVRLASEGVMDIIGRHGQLLPTITWDDVAWLRENWPRSLALKGIVRPSDAQRAVSMGVDAVIVSNHGGRQLDSELGTVEALPAVVEAVGGSAAVILDGGVRRGTDVVKALCLGADAVMMGRPWVYGLALGGTSGVEAVLEVMRQEIRTTMALLGVTQPSELGRDLVVDTATWRQPAGDR